MNVVTEKELIEVMQIFNDNNIVFTLNGNVKEKILFTNAQCKYNHRSGYITIHDQNATIEINVVSVYYQALNSNRNFFEMNLDNGIDITIQMQDIE